MNWFFLLIFKFTYSGRTSNSKLLRLLRSSPCGPGSSWSFLPSLKPKMGPSNVQWKKNKIKSQINDINHFTKITRCHLLSSKEKPNWTSCQGYETWVQEERLLVAAVCLPSPNPCLRENDPSGGWRCSSFLPSCQLSPGSFFLFPSFCLFFFLSHWLFYSRCSFLLPVISPGLIRTEPTS